MKTAARILMGGLTLTLLTACANTQKPNIQKPDNKPNITNQTNSNSKKSDDALLEASQINVDPYEGFNRAMFAFNYKIDKWFLRPVAIGYDTITPAPVKSGVRNFFTNIDSILTIPNDLLQGKLKQTLNDTSRFVVNSTVGIGGIFDPASHMGLQKHHEDFGLTLAQWDGGHEQPYLVLPLLGPSTTRDAFGGLGNFAINPWVYVQPHWIGYAATGVEIVSIRADLLPGDRLVDQSFDRYVFIRDAYLQHRNKAIADNKLPYNDTQSSEVTRSVLASSSGSK